MLQTNRIVAFAGAVLGLALAFGASAQQYADPPERVARLSLAEGNVSFWPAGEQQWLRAMINRTHVRGDRLWSDRRSRAELQLGATALRIGERTSVELLDLDGIATYDVVGDDVEHLGADGHAAVAAAVEQLLG